MNIVLVFRRKILGYGFECEEEEINYQSNRIRDRLDRYLLENQIQKKSFAAKCESSGRMFKGFIGFFAEGISYFPEDLEEVEIETGKYLKFWNSPLVDGTILEFCADKRIQTYLEENNIRTDWMRFSSGRNSYLRVIN
ncbi:hypothetical protein EHQ52_09650 [Leptospira koniambonensis]|uniref:Uncharacterized protein n=1 Tax=Leptospira koniambonensis TaxID=2484950 RepID=A0A4V3JNF0_9LEPT|nr:hypothetical protein [Leptospira koniambonensis]TGL34749.1 hypothetical protein EHQ52_09650 [Leptospira koniambonensis]